MTSVHIESLAGQQISQLISTSAAPMLDPSAAEVLEFCQAMSAECWSGFVGEKLICCWGLIPPTMLSSQAYLWMHSTPAVKEHQFLLVRHSQRIIEEALERYPTIIGQCNTTANDSIRWLKWLGAVFSPDDAGPYCSFMIRKKLHG